MDNKNPRIEKIVIFVNLRCFFLKFVIRRDHQIYRCMKIPKLLFLSLILITGCNQAARQPATPEFQIESFPFEIELDKFITYCQEADYTVAYDPFFGPGTTFRGFSVNEGLETLGINAEIERADSLEIIFICKDGYAPAMPLRTFLTRDAFILPQTEKDLPNWPEEVRKKILPYYITFTDARDMERLPFPYGTIKIKVDYSTTQHHYSFPKPIQKDSILTAGFQFFQLRCGKCHSVNKEGGSVGPELNYPQNITEYRSKEYLRAFIQNPQSFRYNSAMGPMDLSEDEFDLVYGYLRAMREFGLEDQI